MAEAKTQSKKEISRTGFSLSLVFSYLLRNEGSVFKQLLNRGKD
jgi:hypothetical protein